MDEDQAGTFLEPSGCHLLLERQQCLAGVQRFEGNTAGLFRLLNELEQQRIDFGKAATARIEQFVQGLSQARFLHN